MVAAMQDATRGSRKSNIDRLLIAGALSRGAPAARAPHSLQTTPRHFQLQVLSCHSFSTIARLHQQCLLAATFGAWHCCHHS